MRMDFHVLEGVGLGGGESQGELCLCPLHSTDSVGALTHVGLGTVLSMLSGWTRVSK